MHHYIDKGRLICISHKIINSCVCKEHYSVTIPPYELENLYNLYKYCPHCGEIIDWWS